ncbi:hypothetical protein SAMD00019534_108310 [Acytostelium subglobosum LB1]|uniref:hypothetical protein n=1 Tax=Acytostelium subglobosum LB1 TaxID=1410327 RepID=UPI0006451B38|nr:hypothetical protein SAMD00019534_108310 [Acytostelium subglobosum LB1]GAM27655.1 hypothetical protein SAMD00019534_108310 [Acytostelium subglobosum LB1]|eukprot:XP_012749314.1 hypothetical protein SAMD00019534_108310 [Acytostelium subglobosum LB1]
MTDQKSNKQTQSGVTASTAAPTATPAPTPTPTPVEQVPIKPLEVDNLILMVHGIGKHEDNWYSKIERANVLYDTVCGTAGVQARKARFVGVEWHSALHSKTDRLIEKVTPPSIPLVHEFVNHTMLDILFWTSPTYSQTIYTEVGAQLNQKYREFLKECPDFKGKVHILAHSLGSMITYDILCHQKDGADREHCTTTQGNIYQWKKFRQQQADGATRDEDDEDDDGVGSDASSSPGDSLLPHLSFPQLDFEVYNLFSIGSPIGVLYTIRGHTRLSIPKCVNFFNILDQSDPVAYLVEPLIDDGFTKLAPTIIPHLVKKKSPITTNFSSKLSLLTNKVKAFRKNPSNTSSSTSSPTQSPARSPNLESEKPATPAQINLKPLDDTSDDDSDAGNTTYVVEKKDEPKVELQETFSFFGGCRFDYKLQPSMFNISEYQAVPVAHKSYWTSKDVMFFMVERLPIMSVGFDYGDTSGTAPLTTMMPSIN